MDVMTAEEFLLWQAYSLPDEPQEQPPEARMAFLKAYS